MRYLLGLLLLIQHSIGLAQPAWVEAERLAYITEPITVLSFSEDTLEERLFVPCHNGQIWIYENGEILETPFLDLGENGLDILQWTPNAEQGLNGMVLDPDFEDNGLYYVNYNGTDLNGVGDPLEQRMVCFKRDDDDPYLTDTSTWYEVLVYDEGDEPEYGHNGGQLAYGPDGYLYIAVGDGGATGTGISGGDSGGDDHGEFGNGQNLETMLGKILRIETHGMNPYTIPDDNPFVDDPDALDEIWAYGLRNPWKFSFDRETGDLYISDVGEVDWEEINREPAGSPGGLNYGWRLMEGNDCYNPLVGCDDGTLTYPIFQFNHFNGWCAVVGGHVYRGSLMPSLYGKYIFGDFCGFEEQDFWTLSFDGDWDSYPLEIAVPGGLQQTGESRYGFGEDNRGELYLCTQIALYKLVWDGIITIPPFPPVDGCEIYPNPTQGILHINPGQNESIDKVELWDSAGRLITRELLNVQGHAQFNTGGFDDGVYTLKVYCKGVPEPHIEKVVFTSQPTD